MSADLVGRIAQWRQEFQGELTSVINWWSRNALDIKGGGFYGEIDNQCRPNETADKGLVLNARILWFFSKAASNPSISQPMQATSKALADRAFAYFMKYFHDEQYSGAYWRLDWLGEVKESKKQTYGNAFAIYGLVAYYRSTMKPEVLQCAMGYFTQIEQYCLDQTHDGYYECRSRDWRTAINVPMSEKDLASPKTMNNHLHILEAYTALCEANPVPEVKAALRRCLLVFDRHLLRENNAHLKLFLSDDWQQDNSRTFSYGHDIEYSWLGFEALHVLNDHDLTHEIAPKLQAVAAACQAEGMSLTGQLLESYNIENRCFDDYNEWWVQAEALVGFFNAYQISGNVSYLASFERVWDFIKEQHIDKDDGEWFSCSRMDQLKGHTHYKVGFWKGPYHHGRALLEIINRCDQILAGNALSDHQKPIVPKLRGTSDAPC